MKTHFRLYAKHQNDFNSSIFDLINGDKETKQTKGLAYIFSQYVDFLLIFLNEKEVRKAIKNLLGGTLNVKQITAIEVSAERVTTDNFRADIVIKIDSNKTPLLALVIEAKSIKVGVNHQQLAAQIQKYLLPGKIKDLDQYPKLGMVLTKYKQNIPGILNLTWEQLVGLLYSFCQKRKTSEIIHQYLLFLLQTDRSMKYYEKEVLSIPAGRSFNRVEQHHIYVCPDTKDYNFKKALFVTFRQAKGGEMNKLYKIEDIIVLNPAIPAEVVALQNSSYPLELKTRILNYILAYPFSSDIDHNTRFYILSKTEDIDLPLKPKPSRNNAKYSYHTLREILTKKLVVPESQQN